MCYFLEFRLFNKLGMLPRQESEWDEEGSEDEEEMVDGKNTEGSLC